MDEQLVGKLCSSKICAVGKKPKINVRSPCFCPLHPLCCSQSCCHSWEMLWEMPPVMRQDQISPVWVSNAARRCQSPHPSGRILLLGFRAAAFPFFLALLRAAACLELEGTQGKVPLEVVGWSSRCSSYPWASWAAFGEEGTQSPSASLWNIPDNLSADLEQE